MRSTVSTQLALFLLLSVPLWSPISEASIIDPSDVLVAQLELTGGSADYDGRFSRKLDRLLDGPGQIVMDDYQAIGDIVSSIAKGHRTFSLFTSGFNGAPAPSAVIDGSSITVDLSSLFFGVSRGDHFKVWNIGGMATGTFNPDTLEFCLTWEHLFGDRHKGDPAMFSFQGRVITAGNPAPVPLVSPAVFFATGLAMLMGLWRQRMISGSSESISAA
jgi:hypothetical protein